MIDYPSLFIGAGLATAGFLIAIWIYYGFKSKEQIELEAHTTFQPKITLETLASYFVMRIPVSPFPELEDDLVEKVNAELDIFQKNVEENGVRTTFTSGNNKTTSTINCGGVQFDREELIQLIRKKHKIQCAWNEEKKRMMSTI